MSTITEGLAIAANGHYELAGHAWFTFRLSDRESLCLHIHDYVHGLLMIEVRQGREPGQFDWSWMCLLVEGVYARKHGTADSLEAAAQAALDYQPEVVFDSVSGHQWFRMAPDDYFTHFDGEVARVARSSYPIDPARRWRWERDSPLAAHLKPVLGNSVVGQLTGNAESPELAMLAAEQAPADLRRACMQLLAASAQ